MLNQNERRALIPVILDDIIVALSAQFPDKYPSGLFIRIQEGMGFQVPQDTDGDTIGVIRFQTKSDVGFDLFDMGDEYALKQREKDEKAKAAAEAKAKKIARDEKARQAKADKALAREGA